MPSKPGILTSRQVYRALLHLTDWASYVVLAGMAAVVSVEVVCRWILGISTQIAEEAASLGLVSLIFLSLPGAFDDNALLRVDALYVRLRPPLKNVFDILFHLAAIAVTVIYALYIGRLAATSFIQGMRADTALGTPNVVPQTVMSIGFAVLLVAIGVGLGRIIASRSGARGRA